MCFVYMYFVLAVSTIVLLSQPTPETHLFPINLTELCSEIKLRSLFLIKLKFDICFGRNGTTHEDLFKKFIIDGNPVNALMKYENSHVIDAPNATILRNVEQINRPLNIFYRSLEKFERNLYWTTFARLAAIGGEERRENGMSFVQSGLSVFMALLAIAAEMEEEAKCEIQNIVDCHINNTDLTTVLREVTSWLPSPTAAFKFRWVTRLVLREGLTVDMKAHAKAMKLHIDAVKNIGASKLTSVLNRMVSNDSGGAMKNTFEEEELDNGICAALVMTLYIRPQWRVSPVILNGTSEFRDADNPAKVTRMIRINDDMLYADLHDMDAEAVQLEYATPDLALLVLVPRSNSLRSLASRASSISLTEIYSRMEKMRVAVTLPIYTLRMTLLLQNKLEEMGIKKLFISNTSNASQCDKFLLSHAVQRIMFWSEAGRHAYKDDGIQWDKTPEREVIVNRPYLFYVRWKNVTLVNGNFVL